MSTYFDAVPLEVIPLDLAKAADLNSYGTSLDAAFDLVEADIIAAGGGGELWAGVSKKWATEPEDVEVEVGKYSSLHWAAKSEDEAIAASGYAANALVSANNSAASEASCDADVVLTHADVVLTHADVTLTHADVVLTHADVTLTHADVVLTDANAIQTSDDVDATNADVVLTGLDAIDTASDVAATNASVLLTNADVVATNADVVSTGLDVVQTGADVIAASDSAADALASEVAAALSAIEASNSAMGIIDKLLSGINAVDICFSDTTEYRDRCSHTAWENEPLNTATRGATAKIPAKVMIVAETSEVTLYDLTDNDVPMWRVHDFTGYTITSVEMLNGKLVVGTTTGLYTFDYASEGEVWYTTELVNTTVNGIAMTVLPDAPVDPATGVQVFTQAIPTATGGSWIKDDGTVIDATGAVNLVDAGINIDGMTVWAAADKLYIFDSIPTVDTALTSADYIFDTAGTSGPHVSGVISSVELVGSDIIVGTNEGVFQIKYNPTTPAESIVSQTTSTFPSGLQHGDIKGAWLADTDDTDLVGIELVTNGGFDTDLSEWTYDPTYFRWNAGGYAERIATGVSADLTQEIPTVIGEKYILSFNLLAADLSPVFEIQGESITDQIGINTYAFTANSTSTEFLASSTNSTLDLDDVTLRLLTVNDRSVNDTGLAVHGTVALNPVATGAELVAYSGFSGVNYLEGTDASYVNTLYNYGWVKHATNGWEFKHGLVSAGDIDGLTIVANVLHIEGTLDKALIRLTDGTPSAEQIEYIENWEKKFFEEDAKCTLAGTSNPIISLAYDKVTEELWAVTSYGKSIFKDGLLVGEEATTVGTPTCLAMDDGDTAFGGTIGVAVYSPAESLRAELLRSASQIAYFNEKPVAYPFVGNSSTKKFTLPFGWSPTELVYEDGLLVLKGVSNAYIPADDGFLEGVSFTVAPGVVDVVIFAVRNNR